MKRALLAATILAMAAAVAYGQSVSVPQMINYQGKLTDIDGNPLATGNYTLEFNIYNAQTGGSLIWGPLIFDGSTATGHGPVVPVVNGHFNVFLGPVDTDNDPIGDAFTEPVRYLGIKVNGNPELRPRQQILSAPYALQAGKADEATNADHATNANDADTLSQGKVHIDSGGNIVALPGGLTGAGIKIGAYQWNATQQFPAIDASGTYIIMSRTPWVIGHGQYLRLAAGGTYGCDRMVHLKAADNQNGLAITDAFGGSARVGIGTTSPLATLDVLPEGANMGRLLVRTFPWTDTAHYPAIDSTSGFVMSDSNWFLGNGKVLRLGAGNASGHQVNLRAADNENGLYIDSKVGIGTASPETMLDVNGTVKSAGGFQFSDGTVQSRPAIDWRAAKVFVVAPSGGHFTAIQTAINACASPGYYNRYVVYIAPGVYTISSDLNMKPYVSLVGAGTESTVLVLTGATTSIRFDNAQEIYVENLKIWNDCTGASRTFFVPNMASGTRYTYIRDVYVYCSGTNADGLFLNGGENTVQLERVRMYGTRCPVYISFAQNTSVVCHDLTAEANRVNGITIDGDTTSNVSVDLYQSTVMGGNGWAFSRADGEAKNIRVNAAFCRLQGQESGALLTRRYCVDHNWNEYNTTP